jgi:hypothetical protein
MKKVLVTISLVVGAFASYALDGPSIDTDWAVATKLDNGTRQIYEVFPISAEVKIVNKTEVSTSVVRVVNVDNETQMLKRLLVIGCDEGTGKTTLVELDGSEIAGVPIFQWSKDGERVFDGLATLTCVAIIMSNAQPAEPAKTPAPTKHKAIPPGTIV